MKIFLSYPLNKKTPSYGNRDVFSITQKSEIINDSGANTSTWNFSNNHMGTHFDTPHHFFNDGKKTLDYSADDFFFEKVFIIERKCDSGILFNFSDAELDLIPFDIDFLIIKTGYGSYRGSDKYHNDNPGLESRLADSLRKRFLNLRAVGFDFISLTSWNFREHGKISHKSFLGKKNNILIVEDMDLMKISKNTKINFMIMAPLRTSDGNGGPVTIIAEINEK